MDSRTHRTPRRGHDPSGRPLARPRGRAANGASRRASFWASGRHQAGLEDRGDTEEDRPPAAASARGGATALRSCGPLGPWRERAAPEHLVATRAVVVCNREKDKMVTIRRRVGRREKDSMVTIRIRNRRRVGRRAACSGAAIVSLPVSLLFDASLTLRRVGECLVRSSHLAECGTKVQK